MARILLISVVLVAALVACANASSGRRCYGQNEEWNSCGACDSKCGVQVSCAAVCGPGSCGCKRGYVRNDRDVCILESSCPPKTLTCGVNEEIKGCGACDSSCRGEKACTLQCREPECGCKQGYVRDDHNRCIHKSRCPIYKQ